MLEINKILLATSLSDSSKKVYEYAIKLAIQNNAEIIMLHAIEPMSEMGRFFINQYLPDDLIKKVQETGAQKLLAQMQARVDEFHEQEISRMSPQPNIKVQRLVVYGQHSSAILETAKKEKADLIIMGTAHSKSSVNKSYTTKEVIKNARIPVFVVPIENT